MKNRALFAGSWYTDQADTLRSELSSLLEKSPKRSYIAKGAILPHAGLMFSGKGMAHFFKNLDPDIERVVVMAPSHYNYLVPGKIYYGRFEAHETPFGDIGGEMIEPEDDCFVQDNSAVEQEHAAEMFYPFIRFARENASLLVLLIPEISDSSTLETLSARLMETLSKSGDMSKTVFIASSDFTHYGPRFGYVPFGIGSSEDRVADMDRRYADYLAEFRFDTLFEKRREESPTICGINPATLLSHMMKTMGMKGETVGYYNSNEITGRSPDYVCYASILFHQGGDND